VTETSQTSSALDVLSSYVPTLMREFASDEGPLSGPLGRDFPAAVLLADVSGFTRLTEQLVQEGPAGVEKLFYLLNAYFGQLVDLVTDHGGDIVKFAGDALLAIWPTTETEDLPVVTQRAAQAALAVQEALHGWQPTEGSHLALRLSLGAETPDVPRYMAPTGILETGERDLRYSPQSGVDTEPSYYANSFPAKMRAEYEKQWHAEHDAQPGHEPLQDETHYHSDSWNDVKPHLWNFFQAVKTRKPVAEDAVFGNHAAIACHMANESFFRKKPVSWDADSNTLSS